MYRNLVVPLDGSVFSEYALPFACSIAQRIGAALHLVHVHVLNDTIYVEGMPVIDADLHSLGREHERAYLEGIRKRLLSEAEFSISCANLDNHGSVASTLASYVETSAADLVVMTTHGRGGVARAWLGSVADALVRCSAVPILLVRPSDDASNVVQTAQFKHILVPLDGSALSEQILEPALDLGELSQTDYTLLRTVEPLNLVGYAPLAQASKLDMTLTQEGLAEAQRYLDRVAQRLRVEGRSVRTQALLAEQPAVVILDEARRQGADLIAMATHGRSGLARVLLGSVADKVLRGASLPVLVERPRD